MSLATCPGSRDASDSLIRPHCAIARGRAHHRFGDRPSWPPPMRSALEDPSPGGARGGGPPTRHAYTYTRGRPGGRGKKRPQFVDCEPRAFAASSASSATACARAQLSDNRIQDGAAGFRKFGDSRKDACQRLGEVGRPPRAAAVARRMVSAQVKTMVEICCGTTR